MRLDRRSVVLAGLAVSGSTLAACNGAPSAPKGGATPIRFATDWRAEAEQGGFYQALATGEYAKRGLNVTILQGGPGSSVPTLLAAGAVDMGIGSNGFGVLNLAAGKVPAKAVMASMQKDPQVLLAHPDAGIASIGDMKGHPMLIGDEAVTTFWRWLKAKYGFTDDMVRKYTFNAGPFIADKRAVQEGYVSSEPYTVQKQAGFKPEVFLLADNGYPGYAAMVLASERLIAASPGTVQGFVDATVAGWTSYLHGDASPGDRLILKDNPDMRQDVLDQARQTFRTYKLFENAGAPLGSMTDAKWKTFFDMASGLGIYPKDMDYEPAYTLAFAPKAA
jgi:NitT/TauT family transport system substrate-binding protein